MNDVNGELPAYEWLEDLKDKTTRVIIKGRIRRLEMGTLVILARLARV